MLVIWVRGGLVLRGGQGTASNRLPGGTSKVRQKEGEVSEGTISCTGRRGRVSKARYSGYFFIQLKL